MRAHTNASQLRKACTSVFGVRGLDADFTSRLEESDEDVAPRTKAGRAARGGKAAAATSKRGAAKGAASKGKGRPALVRGREHFKVVEMC